MQKKILVLLSLFTILGLTIGSLAQKTVKMRQRYQTPEGGDKWALIIGVNDYRDPITDLKFAVRDAESLYGALTDSEIGGFESDRVKLLTDASVTKPTRDNILQALITLSQNATEKDMVFIFFSGHGIEVKGMSYFLTATTPIGLVEHNGISMQTFLRYLKETRAKRQVMFFDACHSGVAVGSDGKDLKDGSMSKKALNYIFEEAEGRVIFSSCRADQLSYEYPEKRLGVFTHFLLQALQSQPGTGADVDNNGVVSVSEVSNYVTREVQKWSYNKNQSQTPRTSTNVSGDIALTLRRVQDPIEFDGEALDTQPPQIMLTFPLVKNGEEITLAMPQDGHIRLEGQIRDDRGVANATLKDKPVILDGNGRFAVPIVVKPSRKYTLELQATDAAENRSDYRFTIVIPKPKTPLIDGDLPRSGGKIVWEKDGAEMVWIAGGTFEMGSNDGEADEKPVHTVTVDGFYMDIHEVTVGQYKRFIKETGRPDLPDYVSKYAPTDQHPVAGVTWRDAMAYAEWSGKRLPTEAEWEYAARGGLKGKKYPWGDEAPDAGGMYRANYDPGNYTEDGYRYSAPVKSYEPNRYGLYDMAGNVWEWCLDEYTSYPNSPSRNPVGGSQTASDIINSYKNIGKKRVLRGGSWVSLNLYLRVASRGRGLPGSWILNLGFRCVSAR